MDILFRPLEDSEYLWFARGRLLTHHHFRRKGNDNNKIQHFQVQSYRVMMTTTADISGCWLGTYWQAGQPTRFEATLIQGGSVLDGRILDENYLGEAWVKGELLGNRIFFIKRYLTTSPNPIRYSGILSADSNYMHGNWRIGYFDSGSWEAYRAQDTLSEELAALLAHTNWAFATRAKSRFLQMN